jgi:hypothetical protein
MATIELRRSKNGAPSYRAVVRLKGYPAEYGTFKRKTDANKWAQGVEAAMREGRYFKTIESKRHTFSDVAERYLKGVVSFRPSGRVSPAAVPIATEAATMAVG